MEPGRPSSSRVLSRLALVSGVASVSIVVAALVGQNGFAKHDKLRSELERVRSLNEALRGEDARLRREAAALASSEEYIDSVIRDELGFVRKDEIVLIFPSAVPAAAAGADPGASTPKRPSSKSELNE